MIRHGLVHDSPGYVCPFCPLREHKYPRPDNLQRYARSLIDRKFNVTNFWQKGMSESTMSTKTRMTLYYVKSFHSALKAVLADVDVALGLDSCHVPFKF